MTRFQIKIDNLEAMEQFAQKVAVFFIEHSGIIFLNGDLGAGKTVFTQYFAKEMGVKDMVTSPTFNIFKYYSGNDKNLAHFDLYRIEGNIYDQGFEEYWFSDDISIIEWGLYLPSEFQEIYDLKLEIEIKDDSSRVITLEGDNTIIDYLKESLYEFIC